MTCSYYLHEFFSFISPSHVWSASEVVLANLKMSLSSLESGRNRLPYEKEYFLRMLNDIESHVHRGPPPAEINNWKPDPTLEVDKVMIKASTKDVDKLLVNTYPNSAAAALKNKHSSSASSTSSSSTNLSSSRRTSK